jgi:hypothetical protein
MESLLKLYLGMLNRVQTGRVGRPIDHVYDVLFEPLGYKLRFIYWSIILYKLETRFIDLGYLVVQNLNIRSSRVPPLRRLLIPFYNYQIGPPKSSRKACPYHNRMPLILFISINLVSIPFLL